MARPKRALDILVSTTAHTLLVAIAILVPLWFSDVMDISQMERTYLVAPLPPPPPPPRAPAAVARLPHRPSIFLRSGTLYAPRVIPKVVAHIKDLGTTPQTAGGVLGGVPGGVPGGQLGGVLGGIFGEHTHFLSPPPPAPKPIVHQGPYRVGGAVQPPRLIRQVQPKYPVLALETRIQGSVILDCVIDKQGNVTEMNLVSGNPLLVLAAFGAVRDWKYQPTLLNGQPVAVQMEVTVHFTLNS